jgi:putative SOS response-associated peptidase YedK
MRLGTYFFKRIRNQLTARRRPAAILPKEPIERSTDPNAFMNLFLRFETAKGPRTIIAPHLPLNLASEIAERVIIDGHYAEYVDHFDVVSVNDELQRLKLKTLTDTAPSHGMDISDKSSQSTYIGSSNQNDVTPMQFASVLVFEDDKKSIRRMRWGYASKGASLGYRGAHIQSKAESVNEHPVSAESFRERRGLLLAQSQNSPDLRSIKAHRFLPGAGKPIAVAIVWERSVHAGRDDLFSFVVITAPDQNATGGASQRRLATIKPSDWDAWLGETSATEIELKAMLLPNVSGEGSLSTVSSGWPATC